MKEIRGLIERLQGHTEPPRGAQEDSGPRRLVAGPTRPLITGRL